MIAMGLANLAYGTATGWRDDVLNSASHPMAVGRGRPLIPIAHRPFFFGGAAGFADLGDFTDFAVFGLVGTVLDLAFEAGAFDSALVVFASAFGVLVETFGALVAAALVLVALVLAGLVLAALVDDLARFGGVFPVGIRSPTE
jgi:hypothetical protein